MASRIRIGVFRSHQDPSTEQPAFHIKKQFALQYIARRKAVVIDSKHIQFLPTKEVAVSSKAVKSNGQGAAYEMAAIDYFPKFVSGGLTRNEHRPEKFEIGKSARVGHQ
jgi:hypothetical protein